VLVSANAALILPSRSGQLRWRSLWTGLTPTSLWVLGGTLLALVFVTFFPPVARAFGFTVLTPGHWLAALAVGCSLLLFQGSKALFGRTVRAVRA